MVTIKKEFGQPVNLSTTFWAPWIEAAKTDNSIVVVSADSAGRMVNQELQQTVFKDRFIATGIQEANGALISGGLADQGFKVIYPDMGWLFERAYNAVTQTITTEHYNVTIVGSGGGPLAGGGGPSHNNLRDLAVMLPIPNLIVLAPADAVEAGKMGEFTLKYNGPVYVRMMGMGPIIFENDYQFNLGDAPTVRDGADVTIIGMQEWVLKGILAANSLAAQGIQARVLDCSSVKPIGKEAIIKAAKETGAIVTAESTNIHGGMGSAVAGVVGENYPVPLKRIALHDQYIHSGGGKLVEAYYHQTVDDLVAAVKEIVQRKK